MDNDLMKTISNMRKENIGRAKRTEITGREVYIPTREGKTRVLVYDAPNSGKPSPVFFDAHGGGFIKGLPEDDNKFCDDLRNELGITVISIDYRLAPEYKWPKGIYDVYDVCLYVSSHSDDFGIDKNNMAIGGHSAGANIAAVVCMMAKEKKEFSFKCQVLDYPPLDVATPAREKFYVKGAIPLEIAEIYDRCYRLDSDARKSHCSPVYAENEELKDLPPAVVITCEIDSLRNEGEKYACMLVKAGVETTARRFYGVPHGFTISKPDLPKSKESYRMIADSLKKYLLKI